MILNYNFNNNNNRLSKNEQKKSIISNILKLRLKFFPRLLP